MPRILEFSRKISIFIAEKISLCEGEKEKDLARKTVNSNFSYVAGEIFGQRFVIEWDYRGKQGE